MKPTSARPAPLYRNDRVFRSAQNLIASSPAPKRSLHRWPKIAGLAIAVLSSVVLVREYSAPLSDARSSPLKSPGTMDQDRLRTSSPTPEAANREPSALDAAPSPLAVHATATAAPNPGADRPGIAIPVHETPFVAARNLDTWLTSTTDGVTLRGSLSADSLISLPVEIFLRRNDRRVSGVVRYLSVTGERVLANAVSGEINDRSLTLKETARVWEFTTIAGRTFQPPKEIGREFAITLPERSAPQPLYGTWSLGGQRGTLQLAPAPPW